MGNFNSLWYCTLPKGVEIETIVKEMDIANITILLGQVTEDFLYYGMENGKEKE